MLTWHAKAKHWSVVQCRRSARAMRCRRIVVLRRFFSCGLRVSAKEPALPQITDRSVGFRNERHRQNRLEAVSNKPSSSCSNQREEDVKRIFEPHHPVKHFADRWGYSRQFLIAEFLKEPDVLNVHRPATREKRVYNSLRIPESVARRVYARLQNKAA